MSTLILRDLNENSYAKKFCKEYIQGKKPKYIFGRNEYAKSIIENIAVDGVIDDYTEEFNFHNIPIVPINQVPNNALVVVVVLGKPLLAEKRVSQFQFEYLDYYSFLKYSKINLLGVSFWDGVEEDIEKNFNKYSKVYDLLVDKKSKDQFYNIVNFRFSNDIRFMRGFSAIEHLQYFEEFLNLRPNEIFVDVGGFDGFTSAEFIRHCPSYKSVHLFEPEHKNILIAKQNLKNFNNINYYQLGLSNKKDILNFSTSGSASAICDKGDITIEVNKLDDLLKEAPTFIKMDIEGAEALAIEGASNIITKHHPKLAISVYHKKDDLWKIPEQILALRNDYDIYLRHYTEGKDETVMFFIPQRKQ